MIETKEYIYEGVRGRHVPQFQVQWLENVLKIIQCNVEDCNWCITDLAKETNLSERQFYRRVKRVTGLTPNALIRGHRLALARHILENGKCATVAEVSYAVGYKRADYFSTLYNRHYGIKPIEYLR